MVNALSVQRYSLTCTRVVLQRPSSQPFVCYFSPQKPVLCNSNEPFPHIDHNLASCCLRFCVCSARFLLILNCTWQHQSLWNAKPLTHSYAWEALKTWVDRCWFTASLSPYPWIFSIALALPPLSHFINVCPTNSWVSIVMKNVKNSFDNEETTKSAWISLQNMC